MDTGNGFEAIDSSFLRLSIGKNDAGKMQPSRSAIPKTNSIIQVAPNGQMMINGVTVSRPNKRTNNVESQLCLGAIPKRRPSVQMSQNIRSVNGLATPISRSIGNKTDHLNNRAIPRTMSIVQEAQNSQAGENRISLSSQLHFQLKSNITYSYTSFYPIFSTVSNQIRKYRSPQKPEQNTVRSAYVSNAKNMIVERPVWETLFENGPIRSTITIDGMGTFEIEMELAGDQDTDLVCENSRSQYEDEQQVECFVFNPMKFHALHFANENH